MSNGPGWEGSNPLMSGLFGKLQGAAESRLGTADVWSMLKEAAGTYAYEASGGTETPTAEQLQATGAQILSDNGVTIQTVNTYRSIAGSWRTAKENLQASPTSEQVTARDIFTPPWATTTGGESASRYRIRVEWQLTDTTGALSTQWSTYELTAPITSIDNAIQAATDKMVGDRYIVLLSAGATPTVVDYEIEQI